MKTTIIDPFKLIYYIDGKIRSFVANYEPNSAIYVNNKPIETLKGLKNLTCAH